MFFAYYTLIDLLNTLNAATGLNWSMSQLRQAGERIYHLCRLLNIRYGITKKDDMAFPKRLMQPKSTSESAGKAPIGIENAIEAYYKHRGFDDNGVPTQQKLSELGLYPTVP